MKLLGWLAKLTFGAVLAAAVSMLTTFYVVQHYIDRLLQTFNLNAEANRVEISEFLGNLWNLANIMIQGNSAANQQETASGEEPAETDESAPEAVPAWSQTASGGLKQGEAAGGQALVMSEEQFRQTKEKLSDADKSAIFSLLISRLSPDEIARISSFVEGGITAEELSEVEKIVENRLRPEEYEKLQHLLEKYE